MELGFRRGQQPRSPKTTPEGGSSLPFRVTRKLAGKEISVPSSSLTATCTPCTGSQARLVGNGCSVFFAPHWKSQNTAPPASFASEPLQGPPPFFLIPFLLLPLFLLTEDVNISWLRSLALNGARPPHWQWLCPQGGDGLVPKGPIGHREELRFGSK